MDGLSAHADHSELIDWVGALPERPRGIWLVHGEPEQADALRHDTERRLGSKVRVAEDGRTDTLE